LPTSERARENHLGAHRLEVENLLAAHLVGNDEDQLVALGGRDQRQPKAGVARGRFDDDAARAKASLAFSRLDHRQRRTILDRAAGIGALELEKQLARAGVELRDLDHRRIADQRQRAFGRLRRNRSVGSEVERQRHDGLRILLGKVVIGAGGRRGRRGVLL
jgi:hypothetical protein